MRLSFITIAVFFAVCGSIPLHTSGLAYDQDECGFHPSGICCDDSSEDFFCIDRNDDVCWVRIWVNYRESLALYAYIYIYGYAAGEYGETEGVQLIVNDDPNYQFGFHPTDCFPSSIKPGWESFKVSIDAFDSDSYNYIEIEGTDLDHTDDILFIGIDKTRSPATASDLQNSAWSNSIPDPEPWDDNCDGNLMVRVFFSNEEEPNIDFDVSREEMVGIDNWAVHDDRCQKTIFVDQDALEDVGFAQIQIWGHAWGNSDNSNYLYVKINGQNPIYFNPYDVFKYNCWGWGFITFFAADYLIEDQDNTFYFGDISSWEKDNFGIGIDTQNDYDNSWWDWWDGQTQYGTTTQNPTECAGELMIKLILCEKDYPLTITDEDFHEEFSGIRQESYDTLVDLDFEGVYDLAVDFATNGWSITQNQLDGITEGDIYMEDSDTGDSADFIICAGHGQSNHIKLYDDDGPDQHSTNDDDRYGGIYYLSQGILESDYSTGNAVDGFDSDAEWIWFYTCYFFGETGSDTFQTLLYHGAHFVFGTTDTVNDIWLEDIVEDFSTMAFGGYTVAYSYIWAFSDNNHEVGAYYYHSCNADDYLWGVSTGATSDCYKHNDISYYHMEE